MDNMTETRGAALTRLAKLMDDLDSVRRDARATQKKFRERENELQRELESVRGEIRGGAFQQMLNGI